MKYFLAVLEFLVAIAATAAMATGLELKAIYLLLIAILVDMNRRDDARTS